MISNPIVSGLQIDKSFNTNDYNAIYILACNNPKIISDKIYNLMIDREEFNEISKSLVLIKAPIKLIDNVNHQTRINILSSTVLEKYNIHNYKLEEKNLVLPILNISYYDIKLYISQYNSSTNLPDIYKLFTLNRYFNVNMKEHILQYLERSILNLNDTNYWTYNDNCIFINLTKYFNRRMISISCLKNIYKDLGDYLQGINRNASYTDPSKINQRLNYRVNYNNIFTKEDIIELLEKLPDKEQYLLICNLLITKSYCHLILNNITILKMIKTKFRMYAQLFRYLISYAWLRFYFEESIKKSYITKEDQFIFDIDTASELPVYPFSLKYPKLNPYMPILVSTGDLNPENNIGCVSDYKMNSKTVTYEGICNLEQFRRNLNIFCSGDPNFNMFENIEWTNDKLALGGSAFCACVQKSHPLINNFNNYTKSDERLKRYYNEYYAKSDIDIMFLTTDYFDFYNKVKNFYNQIVKNVCKYNLYAQPQHFKLLCDKQIFLFITEKDIDDVLTLNPDYKKEDIINSLDNDNIKNLFKSLLDAEINKYSEKLLSNILPEQLNDYKVSYPDYVNFNDYTFKLRLIKKKEDIDTENDSPKYPDYETNICIRYKYKITSAHLDYPFELFMVKYNDFFATVQTFHLPCVRGYYNGENVYMTPSCISAHLTYMNLDYKYFSGNCNPVEIINKYRMRGFGTWLNEREKIVYLKYCGIVPFWNNLYNIVPTSPPTLVSNLGSLNLNHKLYQPRLYNLESFNTDIPIDIDKGYNIKNPVNNKITTMREYFEEVDQYFTSTTINNVENLAVKKDIIINIFKNVETINDKGSINPLEKWLIEAIWNIMAQTNVTTSPIKLRAYKL